MLATSAGAKIYVSGHRDHEAQLKVEIENAPDRVAILWPPNPHGEDLLPPMTAGELCVSYPDAVKDGLTVRAVPNANFVCAVLCALDRWLSLGHCNLSNN